MPGSNAGTGRPIHFRCSGCRAGARPWPAGGFTSVVLTGRDRAAKAGTAGTRNSARAREYRCLDCGHVGWSRHTDLERKAAAGNPS
jgi:hypothetical protein